MEAWTNMKAKGLPSGDWEPSSVHVRLTGFRTQQTLMILILIIIAALVLKIRGSFGK